ncbi:hypothetical protein WT58_23890 [Burkholderia territorii]|nr:hypothetical protein WT58_23890 [Burkholderia territorii]
MFSSVVIRQENQIRWWGPILIWTGTRFSISQSLQQQMNLYGFKTYKMLLLIRKQMLKLVMS